MQQVNNQATSNIAGDACPETEAWTLSRIFFLWAQPLFRRAAKLKKEGKALEHEDLLRMPAVDESATIGPIFESSWKGGQGDIQPKSKALGLDNDDQVQSTGRIRKAILAAIGSRFIVAGFIKFFNTLLQFAFPLLLNAILKYMEETQSGIITDEDPWSVRYRGYWLSALLFLAMTSKALTESAYFYRITRASYQSRVAVSVAVYNKALRIANAERQSTTLGELVNLMQVDAAKIEQFILQVHVLWDGLFQVTGYIVILYTLIGPSCLAGLAVMILAGPIQGKVMGKLFGMNRRMVKYTDARVKTTNEALQGIQCVKMYTWEDAFKNEIRKSRDQELDHLRSVSYLRGFSRAYMSAVPGLVAVTAFVVFAQRNEIVASTLFAALVAFDQLRFPLLFYPMALANLAQAKVSAIRVENFLRMREIGEGEDIGDGHYSRMRGSTDEAEITLKDATVYWSDPETPLESKSSTFDDDKSTRTSKSEEESRTDSEAMVEVYPKPILQNVSFRVAPGELCAVVGRVGSGKSTLCSAILNETILNSGEISMKGRVAYAAQTPWILNATLRDNILFGLPMDEKKYDRVIKVCQLEHDLDLLENGDMTEIGERGINLSGGQKQRVSIARAAYSESDIIILDDPLSALDPEVGGRLFNECIVDFMKGKTRLFVTNQLQFLPQCDTVVALGKRTVIEHGTFSHLNSIENGEVKRLLKNASTMKKQSTQVEKKEDTSEAKEETKSSKVTTTDKAESEKKKGDGALLTKEERNIGAVAFSVYGKYLKAGGGWFKFALVYFSFMLGTANTLANNAWISIWTTDPVYERHSLAFYLGIYATLAVTLGIFVFIRAFLLARFGVQASDSLHENLVRSVLNAPQSFFDTTPIGRIISRFSKDMYSIDIELADFMDMFLFMSLQVAVSLGTILYVTPWFGIGVVPLGFLYFRFMMYFRDVSRETKRLESISRSPVYAVFSETLGGLTTIRAYDDQTRFADVFEGKVDRNTLATYNNKTADRWLAVRLEMIGASIAGIAALLASHSASTSTGGGNYASLAGLSLTFAISITGMLQWCVRTFAQFEAGMNSCERVLHYTENIPQEAPSTSDELKALAKSSTAITPSTPSLFAVEAAGGKVDEFPNEWPENGAITINNLRMRYRSDTPLVLKGLQVSISGGERIGVVGRTGSGKSSLLLALLRLVEPTLTEKDAEAYEAPISIDGVDVLRIGLKDVRSRLGIIPQKPVLFSGTIKSNIDPFNQYTDEQIWEALEQCGMGKSVSEMPGMLDAVVAEYGENLSAGMCQLLVLGRALLKQCRILLLDEATSSVDYETDKEIQRTIRDCFKGSTVLTIAHRINTIMDSDKILVMGDGLVEEFASPEELLKDENSSFSEIVRHAKSQQH